MAIIIRFTRVQVSLLTLRRSLSPSCRLLSRTMASETATRFDFLVVGGGSGGLAGARRAAELGASTAVIESHKLGGTCVSRRYPGYTCYVIYERPAVLLIARKYLHRRESCAKAVVFQHMVHCGSSQMSHAGLSSALRSLQITSFL